MKRYAVLAIAVIPTTAAANVVWPALYLETRLFSWWAIGIGLVVEFFFVRWLFGMSAKQAAIADLSANAVSAVAGLVLIPLAGVVWELFPGSVINWAFDWGTFNPVTWGGTFLLACLINALLEGAVYKKWFAPEFRFKSRKFLWLVVANAISVGAAFGSLCVAPMRL